MRPVQVTATRGRVSRPYGKWLVRPQDKGPGSGRSAGRGVPARPRVLREASSTGPVCSFGTRTSARWCPHAAQPPRGASVEASEGRTSPRGCRPGPHHPPGATPHARGHAARPGLYHPPGATPHARGHTARPGLYHPAGSTPPAWVYTLPPPGLHHPPVSTPHARVYTTCPSLHHLSRSTSHCPSHLQRSLSPGQPRGPAVSAGSAAPRTPAQQDAAGRTWVLSAPALEREPVLGSQAGCSIASGVHSPPVCMRVTSPGVPLALCVSLLPVTAPVGGGHPFFTDEETGVQRG